MEGLTVDAVWKLGVAHLIGKFVHDTQLIGLNKQQLLAFYECVDTLRVFFRQCPTVMKYLDRIIVGLERFDQLLGHPIDVFEYKMNRVIFLAEQQMRQS